jgi:nucleoid-associated protein YgaU
MEMKLKINRETTIGLSVLLLLLITLGAVAARQFMRPRVPPEAVARAEEKALEECVDGHAKREADARPELVLPTREETPHHESLPLNDPGPWNTAANPSPRPAPEGRRKMDDPPTGGTEASFAAFDRPTALGPREEAKSEKREGEPGTTFAPPELPPNATDSRHSPAATARSEERRTREDSKSLKVEVSDGALKDETPRRLERDAAAEMPASAFQAMPPGPGASVMETARLPPRDRPAAGMGVDREAARLEAEGARSRGFAGGDVPVERSAAGSTYAGGAPSGPAERYREDPAYRAAGNPLPYSSAPTGDGASNYSATPAGYRAENLPRRDDAFSDGVRSQDRPREDGTYEVQPNDSYWTISEKVYHSGAYFKALAEQNRGRAARPDRLPPGLVISTPPVAQLEKDYPDLCPRPNRRETVRDRAAGAAGMVMAGNPGGGRPYVVQEGDTLSSIARNELGKVSRWAEIYQLNRQVLGKDYDYLTPGMRLMLPLRDPPSVDRTARRGDDGPTR